LESVFPVNFLWLGLFIVTRRVFGFAGLLFLFSLRRNGLELLGRVVVLIILAVLNNKQQILNPQVNADADKVKLSAQSLGKGSPSDTGLSNKQNALGILVSGLNQVIDSTVDEIIHLDSLTRHKVIEGTLVVPHEALFFVSLNQIFLFEGLNHLSELLALGLGLVDLLRAFSHRRVLLLESVSEECLEFLN